jgi:hypothetical protein
MAEENIGPQISVFSKKNASLGKRLIITSVFKKNANSFAAPT